MNNKRDEFYYKKRIKSADFDEAAELIELEDEMIFEANEDYQGTIISISELNASVNTMLNMNRIKNMLKKSKNPIIIKGELDFESSGEEFYYFFKAPEAIKLVLDFLKTVDKDLYLSTLETIVGVKEESINIYNSHDKRLKEKNLEEHTISTSRNGKRHVYVALREEFDDEADEELAKYVDRESLSFKDMFKLLHEIAHGFDIGEKSEKITVQEIKDASFMEKLPTVTRMYLSETTAILFENLFGDYLISKDPNYNGLVEQVHKARIEESQRMLRETGFKSSLVREMEEKGTLSHEFIANKGNYYGAGQKELLKTLEAPSLYEARQYSLAMLFVPTMIDRYRKSGKLAKMRLNMYLDSCRNNDFDGALGAFGIDLRDKDCYDLLLENYRKYIFKYDSQIRNERREEQEK